jgi:hypothetical protein
MHLHTCLDTNADSDTGAFSDADKNGHSYGDTD